MSTERTVEDEIEAIEERLDELKEQIEDDEPDFPWGENNLFAGDEKTWCGEANSPYWKIRTDASVFNHVEVCAVRENLWLIESGEEVGEIILHVDHPEQDDD